MPRAAKAQTKKKTTKKTKKAQAAPAGFWGRFGQVFGAFFESPEEGGDTAERWQEIKAIALIVACLWLLLSMVTFYAPFHDPDGRNWGGQLGYYMARTNFAAFGLAGYLVVFMGLGWGIVLLARKQVAAASLRLLAALCCVFAIAFLCELALGDGLDPNQRYLPYGPGGWLAMESRGLLEAKLGTVGLWILIPAIGLVSFMLATDRAFYPSIVAFRGWIAERREVSGENSGQAIWNWSRELCSNLWDFVRGEGLNEEKLLAAGAGAGAVATATKSKSKAKAKAKAKTKAKPKEKAKAKPKPKKKAVVAEESMFEDEELEDELEDSEEPSAELEEDWEEVEEGEEPEEEWDEEEGEYEDEDGEEEWDDEEEEWDEEDDEDLEDTEIQPAAKTAAKEKVRAALSKITNQSQLDFEPPVPPVGEWKYPDLSLLEPPAAARAENDKAIQSAAEMLENALQSFRVNAQVVAAQVGPTVTLFELEVAQGTRMNKVTQLSQEIAAALRAQSVRISAPIPGRATVGIEVPNKKRRIVRMSELIGKDAYDPKLGALPLFLGMDAEGNAIIEDLARMPHLLVAGTTGSGKSVCINTILASMLLTRSPQDVQMILIDPKMVELQMFSNIPHLMLPVVTDMKQATNVLLWAVEKMEGRYELFKNAGVRNIKGYNALGEEKLRERMGDDFSERTPRHVPYIMVVVDEFADLMMVSKKEAEQAITRLAQKSRAVGIHVILATQRPSTDVITGVIKGNLPTRIAFQVASKVDSRVILDAAGAEKLLGGGDMLYNPPQSSKISRVQGALVEDHELQGIVDFVCEESVPAFNQELVQVATGTGAPSGGAFEAAKEDALWDDAVRVILKSKRGSASLLQRALGVGYTRASRLLDMMTEAGIVGSHKGSKAREVLLTLEDWEQMTGEPLESIEQGE